MPMTMTTPAMTPARALEESPLCLDPPLEYMVADLGCGGHSKASGCTCVGCEQSHTFNLQCYKEHTKTDPTQAGTSKTFEGRKPH